MSSEREKLLSIKGILNRLKEADLKRIEKKYQEMGSIKSIRDLIGDKEPSLLFFLQIRMYGYLLKNDPDKTVSKLGVKIRRALHPMIAKKSPEYLMNPQVIENRKFLISEETDPTRVPEDDAVILPDEPVIWLQNHGFKDDALASIAAIPRHTYILFGSIAQFYNSVYGTSAQLGGVAMVNRKVKESRKASVEKAVAVMKNGADIMMCPEATWNKTPELLQLEYWNGAYEIAKRTGAKIVPIVHYLADPFERTNPIHTVIDDPIDVSDLTAEEAKLILRNREATWYYLMMEKYGKTTREELLQDKTQDEAWREFLEKLIGEVDYYDREIECSCDFRDRNIIRPEDAFLDIAKEKITVDNFDHVAYARKLVKERKERDYQRLY